MTEEIEQKTLIPPVNIGDIIEHQEVINSGKKDDGVIKYDGYIMFVNDCKLGDIIDVRIVKILPKFGIGELVKTHEKLEEDDLEWFKMYWH